jgi:hypothetical protein
MRCLPTTTRTIYAYACAYLDEIRMMPNGIILPMRLDIECIVVSNMPGTDRLAHP